jgi:hypothetical protein
VGFDRHVDGEDDVDVCICELVDTVSSEREWISGSSTCLAV